MSGASAWIIGFPGDHLAAVGELELVHVLADELDGIDDTGDIGQFSQATILAHLNA